MLTIKQFYTSVVEYGAFDKKIVVLVSLTVKYLLIIAIRQEHMIEKLLKFTHALYDNFSHKK